MHDAHAAVALSNSRRASGVLRRGSVRPRIAKGSESDGWKKCRCIFVRSGVLTCEKCLGWNLLHVSKFGHLDSILFFENR